jgi:large subunit ribosomal protein L15
MYLNTLKPAPGSKTPGKGHKGQKARAGGYHKVGFEGGQMPLQRRIPKSGFRSRKALVREEIRLSDLNKIDATVIDFTTLSVTGLIKNSTKYVKLISFGTIERAITVRGLPTTAGARKAIEAAGGTVEG